MVCLYCQVLSRDTLQPSVKASFLPLGKCKRTLKIRLSAGDPARRYLALRIGGIAMYAVIRAGGKQYRVAPGDVIEIEKVPESSGDEIKFEDVLAVSASQGEFGDAAKAFVTGQVVEQGRADKILVFHYKRKKQYKKLNGHRQPFTAIKITGINVDGQNHTA
jgi:large subunit ribosomal protein L21